MNILIYAIIFSAKVLENAIGTIRMIITDSDKKLLGAILQFIISIIWIASAGLVLIDINKDLLKALFFALGTFTGSYVGSIMEEKLALGETLIMAIISPLFIDDIVENIKLRNFKQTYVKGLGNKDNRYLLFVMIPRKKRHIIVNLIKKYETNCLILSLKNYTC